jgi:hypothetical protein
MSSTASSRTFVSFLAVAALTACAAHRGVPEFSRVLKDFRHWHVEEEEPLARTFLRDGVLDIDSSAGITLWITRKLQGPVEIEFEATAVDAGGPNDTVSDLNVFWMARNPDGTAPFVRRRSGKFAEYNDLLTYYVGLGGNRNTTTRFRRYIGDPEVRPLLREHDLSAPDTLLVPNRKQKITLIARGKHIEYRRDGKALFVYEDAAPYTEGWFGLRTTFSHLRIENFRVRRLDPLPMRPERPDR